MKHLSFRLMLIVLLVLVPTGVVFAMPLSQNSTPDLDVFAAFVAIATALLSAPGFGSGISIIIQLGKIAFPKAFPDSSAQNWRLGLSFSAAIAIMLSAYLYQNSTLNVEYLDKLLDSFSRFGLLIMPLFVWFVDWFSKTIYQKLIKGTFVGKSHST